MTLPRSTRDPTMIGMWPVWPTMRAAASPDRFVPLVLGPFDDPTGILVCLKGRFTDRLTRQVA